MENLYNRLSLTLNAENLQKILRDNINYKKLMDSVIKELKLHQNELYIDSINFNSYINNRILLENKNSHIVMDSEIQEELAKLRNTRPNILIKFPKIKKLKYKNNINSDSDSDNNKNNKNNLKDNNSPLHSPKIITSRKYIKKLDIINMTPIPINDSIKFNNFLLSAKFINKRLQKRK